MNGTHQHVLTSMIDWLQADSVEHIWLSTVIKTYGSSPRPIGSMMAFHPEKGIVGSLSGGCIEEELIEQLTHNQDFINESFPKTIIYGATAEEQTRLALPCGGSLEIILEKITAKDLHHLQEIQDNLHQQAAWRALNTETGEANLINTLPDDLNTDTFYLHLKPVYQLLLVGAGEVARCVAELAQKVDFQVSLCDYREDFLQGWHVDGVEILREMPDDVIEKGFSHKFCAIIALAHDPRIDDMAMMQALTTDAFYVGAMGSERTSAARRKRLKDLSITDEQMEKLHAPIGLSIRSKTPYEIAFSIVSHLIAERANKTGENSCQQPVCYS